MAAREEADRGRAGRALALAVAALLLGAFVALAVLWSTSPPEGPVAVDWDGVRCARCGMLVSDPSFAAQLHRRDGAVRHYDDPGCALADLANLPPSELHAVWLHHHREDRWIPFEEAAFVRVPHSPMGYRLGAVDAGGSGEAFGLERARELVRSHRPARRGPP